MNSKISIVVPTKNEVNTLKDVLEKTKNMTDDLIVVDGHSTDGTTELAKNLGAKVVLDNGLGKGDALRVGLNEVKNPITVFIDADGSHDPQDIPKLTEPIENDDADLVMGSRMLGGSDELFGDIKEVTRLIGSLVISLSINYRFGKRLTDYQNGFRAIKTEVGKSLNLKSNITTIEQEMAMKCLKYSYRVTEVPTHEYSRRAGVSKIHVLSVSHKYIWSLLSGIFTFREKK
tara:strand:+ start:929 stop:1621 length:693 start_codon:yes stop_codon:yes gene_type:complete